MINRLKSELAKNIKIALIRADMSQNKLSAKTGMSTQTISNYMNGRSYPDLFNLSIIAGAMGTTPKELLPSWYLNTTMNNPKEKE